MISDGCFVVDCWSFEYTIIWKHGSKVVFWFAVLAKENSAQEYYLSQIIITWSTKIIITWDSKRGVHDSMILIKTIEMSNLVDFVLERFSYDLEMKTRQQNRNNKRTKTERFDWFVERIQTRVAFNLVGYKADARMKKLPRNF